MDIEYFLEIWDKDVKEEDFAYASSYQHFCFMVALCKGEWERLFKLTGDKRSEQPLWLIQLKDDMVDYEVQMTSELLKWREKLGFCVIPRVPMLVLYGKLGLLQFYLKEGLLKLDAPIVEPLVDADDVCAICLGDYKFPQRLECEHTFCHGCLLQLAKDLYHQDDFKCPLCRQYQKIPPSSSIFAQLFHFLQRDYDFYEFNDSMTVGEVLAGFASMVGSVCVLEWLLDSGVNPCTKYPGGNNLLHLACKKGRAATLIFLGSKFGSELGRDVNDDGETFVEVLFKYKGASIRNLINCADDSGALPKDWWRKGLESDNEQVKNLALEWEQEHISKICISKLNSNITLSEAEELFKTVHQADQLRYMIEEISETLVKIDRPDLLWCMFRISPRSLWIYGTTLTTIFEGNEKFTGMLARIEKELENFYAYNKCRRDASSAVGDGCTAEEFDTLTEKLTSSYATLDPQVNWEYCKPEFEFDGIVRHRMDALSFVIYHGYSHLFSHFLTKYHDRLPRDFINNPEKVKYVSKPILEFYQCYCKEHPDRFDEITASKYYSFLEHQISKFLYGSFDKEDSIYNPESVLDTIEYLTPFVDDKQPLLVQLCSFFSDRGGVNADQYLKVVKLFVEGGADVWTPLENRSRSFLEEIVRLGRPLFLETIRYLALEKGYSIEYMEFGRDMFSRDDDHPAAVKEFKRIQKLQAEKK